MNALPKTVVQVRSKSCPEPSRVGWFPGTEDEAIEFMIAGALSLDLNDGPLMLTDDRDGCLVPCCAQLPAECSFLVSQPRRPRMIHRLSSLRDDDTLGRAPSLSLHDEPHCAAASQAMDAAARPHSNADGDGDGDGSFRSPLLSHDYSVASFFAATEAKAGSNTNGAATMAAGGGNGGPMDFATAQQIENNVTKFERMASHLANERTFLAWVRPNSHLALV